MVQHDEVAVRLETGSAQVIGAGQTRLTCAYDDDLDLARVVHASTNRPGGKDLPARAAVSCQTRHEPSEGRGAVVDGGRSPLNRVSVKSAKSTLRGMSFNAVNVSAISCSEAISGLSTATSTRVV